MKGLFASDYDGTIHFEHVMGGFHQEDLEAIRTYQESGNLFGICTGRSLYSILHEVEKSSELNPDFIIAASGAVIANGKGDVISADYLSYEDLLKVYKLTQGKHMFIPKDNYYLSLSDIRLPLAPWIQQENTRIEDFKDEQVDTFSLENYQNDELWKTVNLLKEAGLALSFFVNAPSSIDFVAAGNSKGQGVLKAAQIFGIDPQNTAAMGDSWNDISMLETAAYSWTFHNSDQSIKEKAGSVAFSLAEALTEFQKKLSHQ